MNLKINMDHCDEILEMSTLYRQRKKWIEECNELRDALLDGTRINNMIDEIGDVLNCIGQVCLVYDISEEEINAKITEKKLRTIERINKKRVGWSDSE